MSDGPNVLILCKDLLFTSSLHGAVQRAGLRGRTCLSVDQCMTQISEIGDSLRCLIADLEQPDLDLHQLKAALGSRARLIVFGPHVRTELFDAAQAAGADLLLTRGQAHSLMDSVLAKFSAP